MRESVKSLRCEQLSNECDLTFGTWLLVMDVTGPATELASVFLGQTLGFTAHTLEMHAAYSLSAALASVIEQGGWIETIPNPNYRPKGLFG